MNRGYISSFYSSNIWNHKYWKSSKFNEHGGNIRVRDYLGLVVNYFVEYLKRNEWYFCGTIMEKWWKEEHFLSQDSIWLFVQEKTLCSRYPWPKQKFQLTLTWIIWRKFKWRILMKHKRNTRDKFLVLDCYQMQILISRSL